MNFKTNAIQWRGKIHHVSVSHAEHATHAALHHTLLEHKNLNIGEVFDIFFLTPPRSKVHFTYEVSGSKSVRVQVYGESVVTGATQVSRSRNMSENRVPVPVIITLDGTVVSEGNLLADNTLGSIGLTPHSGQGGTVLDDEFYLPENFTLRFKCTSLDDDNNVNMRMNFIIEPMLEEE